MADLGQSQPPMRLVVPIPSREQEGLIHAVGSRGCVVEKLGPDVWLVEVRVRDETLVGGAWYEVFEVRSAEIEIMGMDPTE